MSARFLSVAELAASAGTSEAKMRRILTYFEGAGIAERVDADAWRMTDLAAVRYRGLFETIESGNVPLEPGDDDGLTHCKPGPPPAAERAA